MLADQFLAAGMTAEAFEAIAATLLPGSVDYELELRETGMAKLRGHERYVEVDGLHGEAPRTTAASIAVAAFRQGRRVSGRRGAVAVPLALSLALALA